MDNVPITDEFGNIVGDSRIRRFHDAYSSASTNVRVGALDKKFADDLSLDLTFAQNNNNIQHSDFSINRVYNGLNEENISGIGVLRYQKKIAKWDIAAKALVGQSETVINDKLFGRRYRWDQSYVEIIAAELFGQVSEFHIVDRFGWANINANYQIQDNQLIKFNLSHNQLERQGFDEINPNNLRFTFPSHLNKNIAAASYQFESADTRFQASTFAKQYFFNATINAEEYVGDSYENVETTSDFMKTGYGATARYTLNSRWNMKLSVEKAYRLPEAAEILGDGLFVDPNPQLDAESSLNVNYGAIYRKSFNKTQVKSEANLFYRPTHNFIRLVNDRGIRGRHFNVEDVRIVGIESSSNVNIQNKFTLGFNWTYQSITDQTEFYQGLPNDNFEEKIPNTPYFFWNARAAYHLDFEDESRLSFNWATRYVHEFYLYWERFGNREDKNQIPTQFIQDIDINYSFNEGKYNASLSVRNLLDRAAYDNFNIQKPGRAIYLKLRYYLNTN